MAAKSNDAALVARVVELWNGGMSMQDISEQPGIGKTRNVVLGIIRRERKKHPHLVRAGDSPIKAKRPPPPERIRGGLPPLPSEMP